MGAAIEGSSCGTGAVTAEFWASPDEQNPATNIKAKKEASDLEGDFIRGKKSDLPTRGKTAQF